ncbi:MAG: UDP-N-acetylmuramate--L-alanine ligase [Candidatus Nealsonbacteria bacterium CG08_land_8_20_14_0_20_38_20]|uniref:UDP-N-acetylmuramate--L-alanine ligase n=1 Tax=Candidatus Nealsonbacteria bacterium CG08_land_8_20_14_0_20_38_20 TaxID=1974705 RepID=A0A2H0YL75_9BACT|nr:MAG: UDP-N-acetylmuramate--L-alanine ligase [Candidatus Nealsonbacteria bacterium CG08_land_8_20_14_0_20_38_20]
MKIHFIGIGGIGVSALAKYYLAKGHKVSGSDLVSSEITEALKKLGAKIFIGHSGKNLPKDTDLVIYSPAVQKTNLELNAAFKIQPRPKFLGRGKIQILSYPEALGDLTKKYWTIAVCGSHGKSTVTAMIGLILTKAGLDPTVIVGTKVKEFGGSTLSNAEGSNCRVGKSKYLVIEADEHFASFLNYWPKIIVLTNLEPDHLDFYKNLRNYILAFKKFISHLPKNGILITNKDDKNIKKMLRTHFPRPLEKVLWYFLKQKEAKKLKKILKIPGGFNVSNGLAALTAARALKIPDKTSFKALSEYRGSWRRFDVKKLVIGHWSLVIVNDYAHHPTQVKVTLRAARKKFPKKKIWCIFQPHQHQRTYYLWNDFVNVFSSAPVDKIIITDIYDVAGREDKKIKKLVNSKKLVEAINKPFVSYLPKEKIINYLKENLKSGEVVIIMGAGDIYNLTNF